MLVNWPFAKVYRIKCPDGSIKTVYRQVDDAFPLYIQGWQGDLSAEFTAMETLPAKVKAAYASKLQGLLYGLDDLNRSLMMKFRGAYVAYQNDPCGASAFFQRQVERILSQQHKLSTLRIQIQAIIELAKRSPNDNNQILSLFKTIVDSLHGRILSDAAAMELVEIRQVAKNWIEGSNDGR